MHSLSDVYLAYDCYGDKEKPVLVFLHGFLGSGEDWIEIIDLIKDNYYCITIDLAGHGKSSFIEVKDFFQISQLITNTINKIINNKDFYLLGYSLGGRIAMYLSANCFLPNLKGLIIENSHLGLDESERQTRFIHDKAWAKRFEKEKVEQVLFDWYQQSLFQSLNLQQKTKLIEKRLLHFQSNKYPEQHYQKQQSIAKMLLATSLSQQPKFNLASFSVPIIFLCGENDKKFSEIAENSGFSYRKINNAGHNIHLEQPDLFAKHIIHWIQTQIS